MKGRLIWAEIGCMPTGRAMKTRWNWARPNNNVACSPLTSYCTKLVCTCPVSSSAMNETMHTLYNLTDFLCIALHSWTVWCVWFRWAVVWMRWPPGLHKRPLTLLHLGAILNACYGYSKQVQISTDRYDIRCTLNPCLRTVVNWIVKFSSLKIKQLVKCVYSSFTWEHFFWSGAHKQVIPQRIQTIL